jgi:TonB family protein
VRIPLHTNLLSCCLLACPGLASGQVASTPEAPKPAWRAVGGDRQLKIEGDVQQMSGSWWVRTSREYLDTHIQLEFRIAEEDSEGSLLVRAIPGRHGERALSGYRVFLGPLRGRHSVGTVEGISEKLASADYFDGAAARAVRPNGAWQELSVDAREDELTVALNGEKVAVVAGHEHQAGYVAIEVRHGMLEIRRIQIKSLAVSPECYETTRSSAPSIEGDRSFRADEKGVKLPRVKQEVRPWYSVEAMTDKRQGAVQVDAVVLPDGSVGRVCITKGLNPDLDVEAVAAARKWRFEPGTLDGRPVPVLVTIELTFRLRL